MSQTPRLSFRPVGSGVLSFLCPVASGVSQLDCQSSKLNHAVRENRVRDPISRRDARSYTSQMLLSAHFCLTQASRPIVSDHSSYEAMWWSLHATPMTVWFV